MYSCYQGKIVPGTESFPLPRIVPENLLYLAMWALAGFLLWPIWTPGGLPVLSIGWAIVVVVVQVLLKKHNCSGCYYYGKRCHLGWGKITSAMFPRDSGDPKTGMRLTLFYIVPPPVILLASLVHAIRRPDWVYWSVLGLYVVLNAVSFPVRISGCGKCAMKAACPGSAVKGKRPA